MITYEDKLEQKVARFSRPNFLTTGANVPPSCPIWSFVWPWKLINNSRKSIFKKSLLEKKVRKEQKDQYMDNSIIIGIFVPVQVYKLGDV